MTDASNLNVDEIALPSMAGCVLDILTLFRTADSDEHRTDRLKTLMDGYAREAVRAALASQARWRDIETAPENVRVLLGPREAPVVGVLLPKRAWVDVDTPRCSVLDANDQVLIAGYLCTEWAPLPAGGSGAAVETTSQPARRSFDDAWQAVMSETSPRVIEGTPVARYWMREGWNAAVRLAASLPDPLAWGAVIEVAREVCDPSFVSAETREELKQRVGAWNSTYRIFRTFLRDPSGSTH